MLLPIGDETPRRTFPIVTLTLIVANVVVFLMERAAGDAFVVRWAFVPARFMADPVGQYPTILAAMFMHAGWLHLGGNMLYLWIFGDNVEDRFGHLSYTLFYLACGLAATAAQFAFAPSSNVANLGASGAIAGVLGAYMLMYPGGRVQVLFWPFILPLPSLIVIGGWFVLQLLAGYGSLATLGQTGGVAYLAHVGGFVAGLVLAMFMRRSGAPRRAVYRR